ncbi:MAG: T9SS type A sorting domain-containing protein [Bacteroidales bacterium]|nr:T9SS type A sorting domain-containing protein [Bacteroidales bacterium]
MTGCRFICRIIYLLQVVTFCGNAFNAGAQTNSSEELLNAVDIKFYHLDLEVNNMSTEIKGNTVILASVVDNSYDSLALELATDAVIDSMKVNSISVEFSHYNDMILFPQPQDAQVNDILEIIVYYQVASASYGWNEGIYNEKNLHNKSVTWTLSEPFASKSWFPCKQVLDDKADSLYVFLTAPDSVLAGSNGLLTDIVELENNSRRFEWKSRYPIAYYLISFAVADYMDYSFMASTADGDSVLVQNYIYNDSAYFLSVKPDIDATAQLIELFSEKFGVYPFSEEKYGHCVAPMGGGMEHQTMTTLVNFSFALVAHELAHQWFGDEVTCSDWQHIWINEGFASYAEYIAIENLLTKQELQNWLGSANAYILSAPDGSVYVPENSVDDENRIFDYRLSYRKGALLLHMMRHELGSDELFFNAIKLYVDRYGSSVASAEDFKDVVEEISGIDFDNFFEQWYYGEGYPIFNLQWKQNNDSLYIYSSQTTSFPSVTPFFNTLIDLKIEYLDGDTIVQVRQEASQDTFVIPMNKSVYRISVDPDMWLIREIDSIDRIFSNKEDKYFNLFPNPASDHFYIQNYNIGQGYRIKIYNFKGSLMKDIEGYEVFTKVDISDLTQGIYQVIITSDQNKSVFKLIRVDL